MKVAHEKHPRCPTCGKALYKRPNPGPVKKTDPYIFCRNVKCKPRSKGLAKVADKIVSKKETAGAPKKTMERPNGAKPVDDPIQEPKKPKRRARPASEFPKKPAESPEIAAVRAQIKTLLEKAVPEGTPKASVGLMLAILNHELGSFEASNIIIRDFNLSQVLGFREFGPKGV